MYAFTNASALALTVATPIATIDEPSAVVSYWRAGGAKLWFGQDAGLDRRLRDRLLETHEAASRGELRHWPEAAEGALALVLLLDQFPRNAFRGTPRMYATDAMARLAAAEAILLGHDRAIDIELALFFYLPFAHSEELADQHRSVALCWRLGEPHITKAERHRDIVRRFGRFPHRNPILGRMMTAEEQRYLDEGGFKG